MRRLIARVLQVTFAAVAVSWTLAAQAPAPAHVTAQDNDLAMFEQHDADFDDAVMGGWDSAP